jgi:hypothetical protein
VTNPLLPAARVRSAVMLGRVDGRPLRIEITLLPHTRTIVWNGKRIEAVESQFTAFVDGRIQEVALDRFAQADGGAVWYLGEDVFNYENGAVADTDGTWLAGRDGLPAMIMPARPRVGDVYRPENIPSLVFEEVTVEEVGKTVDGPAGPVRGAVVVRELHMDGSHEDKTFAPGYGEFTTGAGSDLEAIALAVPTDALRAPVPAPVRTLASGAEAVLDALAARSWPAASAAVGRLNAAWAAFRGDGAPALIGARVGEGLRALSTAVRARRSAQAVRAALDVALSAQDLRLRHRPAAEIDRARFDLWARRLGLDAAAGNAAGVRGDVTTLEWIRDRFAHTLPARAARELDGRLRYLRAAADAGELEAAAAGAAQLRSLR